MKSATDQLDARHRIIVALDVPDGEQALSLVRELRDAVGMFKVGLQLFVAEGPAIVRAIRDEGAEVFVDLKLHDIPNTVARAVDSVAKLGATMLTLHLIGGPEMIRAALGAAPPELLLLGVTVLTSSSDDTLRVAGVSRTVAEQVITLAEMGHAAGLRGFVASGQELAVIRSKFGNSVQLVIPGIRPANVATDDQARVMSPREAVALGADYLVIGRPITAAEEPLAAVAKIMAEIDGA